MLDFDKWAEENKEELALAYKDFLKDADDGYFIEFDHEEEDWLLDSYEDYLAKLSVDSDE